MGKSIAKVELILVLGAARIVVTLQGVRIAIATVLLLLVNPLVLIYSTTSLSDVLGAALPILAVLCLLDDEKGYRVFLAGLCLGLAWSVRSINLVFLPLVFVIAWNHRADCRKTILLLVWAVAGLLLGGLPQTVINVRWFGNPFYSENWRNTAALIYDWERVNRLTSFSQVVQADGLALIAAWLKQFFIQIPEALFHAAYLPILLALPGLVFLMRRVGDAYRPLVVVWGITCLLYLAMVASVWRIELRYFLVVLPLVLFSAVVMWDVLTQHAPVVFVAGIALAFVISGGAAFENTREMLAMQNLTFRQAGLYLKEHAQSEDKILAVQPHILFYAERQGILFENLSTAELSDLPTAVQARGIQWVVFDREVGLTRFPTLERLLDVSIPFSARWSVSSPAPSIGSVIWRAQ